MVAVVASITATSACTVSESRLTANHADSANKEGPRITLTRGVGLVFGRDHIALGLMKELVVEVEDPQDCRIIIVLADPKEATQIKQTLATTVGNLQNVCLFPTQREQQ